MAPVACCVLDHAATIVDANAAAAALLRVERVALLGAPFAQVAASDDTGAMARHVERSLIQGGCLSTELTLNVPGRGEVVIEAVSTPVIERDEAWSLTMLHDVTTRRRAERRLAALALATASLATPLGSAPSAQDAVRHAVPGLADGCFLDLVGADRSTRRVEVAAAGPRAGEIRQALWRQNADAEWRAQRESILTSSTPVFETDSAAALGARCESELRASANMILPLVAGGRPLGLLGFVMVDSPTCRGRRYGAEDFEAAKDLARCLALALDNAAAWDSVRNRVRAQDQTLTSVAHDLRQPLSAITGWASFGRQLASGEVGHALQTIRRAAKRMSRLVDDLLDLESIEGGRLALDCRILDIATLVTDIVDAFAIDAAAKPISLRVSAPGPLDAFGDSDRIAQVISNFVDNALKFTPPGGDVRVEVVGEPDCVRVSVADTGPGIPRELVPHVFERFWRADARGARGHGLGLSIAQTIVEASHGTIGVDSTVGEGSRFFFTLPRMPA